MAKTVLLGEDKEKQKKALKAKTKKKRRSPVRFFKDIWSEIKKVTWPTRKELTSYSLAVIAFIIIMAAVAGLFDFGLGQLFGLLIKS